MLECRCPSCGHRQYEPTSFISTYCQTCGEHLEQINGEIVLSKRSQTVSKARPFGQRATRASKREPALPSSGQNRKGSTDQENTRTIPEFVIRHHQEQKDENKRDVSCFRCEMVHRAPQEAQATNCPKCGAYIDLKDFNITSLVNKPIRTRGNIFVSKKGRVVGTFVHCHHLTIHGEFTGGIDCSGDLIITKHGRIMGRVQCAALKIQKRAKVEFANAVHCSSAHIDGEFHGHIISSGKIHLAPKAKLFGNIKMASLQIEEGAKHQGQVAIYSGKEGEL